MTTLVTGGGGFLGSAIVPRLVAQGHAVRSFSRSVYPKLSALGVSQYQGDLSDVDAVFRAVAGCDLVFHVAARAGIDGRYRDYYRANVVGTKNILDACQLFGVQRLVYTSSPSVVFDGKDMEGADETVPYPRYYEAHYPKTKAIAEKMILSANGPLLATVALRPHLIWGPEDNHLIPRLIARARAGRLRRIGNTSKLIDTVYIDNAAQAHLLAAERLFPGSPIAGKVYFITQGEPVPLWDLVNRFLEAANLPPVQGSVPAPLAKTIGGILEIAYAMFQPEEEPPMTRFLAGELSTAHWFNIDAARRDLGYKPEVTTEAGLRHLTLWLQKEQYTKRH